MPKKSGLMNNREREICARVKSLRESLGFSQPVFAKHLGLTLDQIASIEYGRNPLRWALGDWICRRFDVNPRWLAEGREPRSFYVLILKKVYGSLPPNALYSQVFDDVFKPYVEERLASIAKTLRCKVEDIKAVDAHAVDDGVVEEFGIETLNLIIGKLIDYETAFLPQFLYQAYYSGMVEYSREFRKAHKKEIEHFQKLQSEVKARRADS